MIARPNWKGHLKLSLVSCAVALYPATTERERVAFHMLNRKTGHRLRRQMIDDETGETVEAADQAKGFEVAKNDYVLVEGGELDAVALESTHTIDIDGFVKRSEVADVYLDTPYYLTPDDKVGREAFAVIREAMKRRGMAGLARVVLHRRERVLLLESYGAGIVATTLRYAYEVKDSDAFFETLPQVGVPAEMLDLAEHIIDKKLQTFDPTRFKDRYEDAVKDLIALKSKGRTPAPSTAEPLPSNVIDLMEALRRSVAGSGATAKPAPDTKANSRGKPAKPPRRKPAARSLKEAPAGKAPARQRKAG